MEPALSVDDLKVIFLQVLKPTCQLAFRFTEVAEPYEGTMVSPKRKPTTQQVGMEVLHKCHNSQQLTPCDTVFPLCFTEQTTTISYNMLMATFIKLGVMAPSPVSLVSVSRMKDFV